MAEELYNFLIQAFPYILRRKRIPYELFKSIEKATYSALILSYLYGRTHIQEKYEAHQILNFSDEIVPEEAIKFLREKLSIPAEEFYKLDAKARFRAFTVALLTGLDAIERVKEKLLKALEEGKTLKEFIEELGQDEVIEKAGFAKTNPWYWETVFRTNLHSAYNAGRLEQIQRLGKKVKYLKFIAIDDDRTTKICRSLNGTVRPADDSFWSGKIPPLHFRCRSTVVPIFKGEGKQVKITKNPPDVKPQEGFGEDPRKAWWELTDSMARRIAEYGYADLVEEKAKKLLCGKKFGDEECPEFKDAMKKLEAWKKQKKIEAEFLKRVKNLKWDTEEEALESFKRLWVKEKHFTQHLEKRLKEKSISGKSDYILKTFRAIAEAEDVFVLLHGSPEFWVRVYYKNDWVVVLSKGGNILTSMPLREKEFKLSLKRLKEIGYERHPGRENERLRRIAKALYNRLRILFKGP